MDNRDRENDVPSSRTPPRSPVDPIVRQYVRQGLRRADITPELIEERMKQFGEIHGPFKIANPELIDWDDILSRSSCVASILWDEETGEKEVTITYRGNVDP